VAPATSSKSISTASSTARPEISALILRKLKEAAEAYLGHTVRKAVVTVPAYFNDSQRQATIDAAPDRRLRHRMGDRGPGKPARRISSGCASSTSRPPRPWPMALDRKKDEKIAVFDLGGGTFDISILSVGDGVFEVKGRQRAIPTSVAMTSTRC